MGRFDVAAGEDAVQAIGAAARGASTPGHAPRCARLGPASVFALAAVRGAIVTIHAPGIANADVCV